MQYVIIGLLLNSEAAVSKCLLANCSCTVHHSSMKTSENINKFIKWTLQCKFKFKSTSGHILHSASQHDNLAILFFFWLLLPSSVETLTLEDVVHCTDCKAHWGTVIMTFGYIDKLIWLFLPTILFVQTQTFEWGMLQWQMTVHLSVSTFSLYSKMTHWIKCCSNES